MTAPKADPLTSSAASAASSGSAIGRSGSLLADAVCLALLAFVAVTGFTSPDFSPDAWSMFEQSNHIFDDFYRINTYRQFQFNAPYGVSFAPLFSVLLAIVRKVANAGIYTGLFLNTGIAVVTLWQSKRLARAHGLPIWSGNLWLLILLANFDYCDEMIAGRTMPLAALLLTVLLRTWIEAGRSWFAQPVQLGAVAGLLALTRFEFLLVAVLFGAIGRFTPHRWSLRQSAAYYVALAVVMSPWCFYSYSHFGKLFTSDNSRTVLSAERTFVMDYFPAGAEPPTVKTAPVRWVKSVLTQRLPSTIGATLYITYRYFPVMLLAGALAGLALCGAIHPKQVIDDPRFRLLLWFGLVLSSQLAAVCLTGYKDVRYFIPFTWWAAVVCSYVILSRPLTMPQFATARKYATPLLALLTLGCYVRESDFKTMLKRWPPRYDAAYVDPDQYAALSEQLHADFAEPRVLAIVDKAVIRTEDGRIKPGFNAFRFGALTGIVTFVEPTNFKPEMLAEFARQYEVTHVYTTDAAWKEPLEAAGFIATPVDGLYRASDASRQAPSPRPES